MSNRLLEELRRENLCTHFILPLLKLNKVMFVGSNFVDSYLSKDKQWIIVKVIDQSFLSRNVTEIHPNFHTLYSLEDYTYVVYSIGTKWREDVERFSLGRFSTMSEQAKDSIRRWSGLDYNKKNGTDGRLLALEKHSVLRKMWIELIEPNGTIPEELLSIPGEKSYIDLEVLGI